LQANLTGNQSKLTKLLEEVFNNFDYPPYKNQFPLTTEKYNPFKRTMWEYLHTENVGGSTTEVRGELELLSQKIIIGK
jgi:hypothetical protein